MVEISATVVKTLREKTGAGIMDCKSALAECNGDIEAATDYLRKKGLAAASKKAGRVAAEGLIACHKTPNTGSLVELNSETDFVARNDKFQLLAVRLASVASNFGNDVEKMKEHTPDDFARSVAEEVVEHIAIIGENINLRRIATLHINKGVIGSYVHNCVAENLGKIGVLVALESDGDQDKLLNFGKQLCMHIAAARPEALKVEDLDQALVEKETEIIKAQALESGKPAAILDNLIKGRIRKFYEEVVLMEQTFIIDNKTIIKDLLAKFAEELGFPVVLKGYMRFSLGEGIDREESA
jgi:elongation factor Ts